MQQSFFSSFFLSFSSHTFRGLAGAYVNPGTKSFCIFICVSNTVRNSIISAWISVKHQYFSHDSSRIPPPLIQLLECNLTWTTTARTVLLRATLQQLQPPQPIQLIREQNVDIYLFVAATISLPYLRTTEASLCYFVACLGQQGLAHSTIRTYLSGIRQFQIAHGYK